ncbi:ABC transporter permease [Georgenia sp. 311]|uniref:ABC transporter permease n=1 Tax=Georgenia sp. 311 TaxID=2585134 RepID=UPI001111D72A|nr:ABC transporter permease [Georgenia sp. 311]TNC17295.1 ABC transporter permease [Georgenia sp. 311]
MSATARRVWAQTRFETVAVLRNGEQLVLMILLPAIALVVLTTTDLVPLPEPRADAALGGALAMAVASSFTSQAIAVAFDRRWGVLRMLATTPLGPRGLLAGKLGAVLLVLGVQVLTLLGVALAVGWRPDGVTAAQVGGGAVLMVVGTGVFVAFALLLGGTLRPEAVLAIANLLFVLMVVGGGLLLPLDTLPAPLAAVAAYLPPGALGEALRTLCTVGQVDLVALGVLAAWAVAGGLLATRSFRWDA